jgi:MinD-like ATPase involved in chromosome partitioning or flagellar assembly
MYQSKASVMVRQDKALWTIECEKPIGPLSSYALALWGLRGLLYPNDLLTDQNHISHRVGLMHNLRDLVRNKANQQRPIIWAIAGRKGGVGKSVVCSLMGIALSKLNFRTTIIDGNYGCPVQTCIFGIDKKSHSYFESIHGRNNRLSEFSVSTSYPNLNIISYQPSPLGPMPSSIITKMKFIQSLKSLDTDYVLLDLGSRIDDSGLDYFLCSDANIIISTPELPSIQNVCLLLKSLLKRKLDTAIFSLVGENAIDGLEINQNGKTFLQNAIDYLKRLNLPYHVIVNRAIKSFNVKVIFNMVTEDGSIPKGVIKKYFKNELGMAIDVAGVVNFDPLVRRALLDKDLGLLEACSIMPQVDRLIKDLVNKQSAYSASPPLDQIIVPYQKKNKIMCGISCSNWEECERPIPGYACPYKNLR